jgi:hypothetical protein
MIYSLKKDSISNILRTVYGNDGTGMGAGIEKENRTECVKNVFMRKFKV